jgi:hypothetical protein
LAPSNRKQLELAGASGVPCAAIEEAAQLAHFEIFPNPSLEQNTRLARRPDQPAAAHLEKWAKSPRLATADRTKIGQTAN